MSRWIATLCSVVVLVGCTATSQILPVTPVLNTGTVPARGGDRTLALDVVDARNSSVVGYRDPKDMGSAITTAPEAIANIRTALAQAYTKLGFRVVPAGTAADIVLTVRLVELGYTRQASGVIRNLSTGAMVDASSVIGEKIANGVYRYGQGKDTVLKPSLQENASILNGHLNAALIKLLADPRLTSN